MESNTTDQDRNSTQLSSDGQAVLLADRDTIFTMDMEEQLAGNGFNDLAIESVDTEETLMETIPRLKPNVLVLGDISTKWNDGGNKSVSGFPFPTEAPFLEKLLETYPDLFIVNVRAMPENSERLNQDRMVNLKKPVTENAFMDIMDEQLMS